MVHTIRTVEHDTLLCEGFSEIFGWLSFTGTSGTCRGSTKIELERSHKRHIALIGKWGDN